MCNGFKGSPLPEKSDFVIAGYPVHHVTGSSARIGCKFVDIKDVEKLLAAMKAARARDLAELK